MDRHKHTLRLMGEFDAGTAQLSERFVQESIGEGLTDLAAEFRAGVVRLTRSADVMLRLAQSDAPRRIVLDTETTGLDPAEGHRVIELAALELIGTEATGRVRVWRFNPGESPWSLDAEGIHGFSRTALQEYPTFDGDVLREVIDWVQGAELVAHHAAFDLGHLRAEVARATRDDFAEQAIKAVFPRVICTRELARELLPELPSRSLDALCDHFGIDRSARAARHTAEVDVTLLAQVFPRLVALQEARTASVCGCGDPECLAGAQVFDAAS